MGSFLLKQTCSLEQNLKNEIGNNEGGRALDPDPRTPRDTNKCKMGRSLFFDNFVLIFRCFFLPYFLHFLTLIPFLPFPSFYIYLFILAKSAKIVLA